jgi:Tfp pilus assembly protein PilO
MLKLQPLLQVLAHLSKREKTIFYAVLGLAGFALFCLLIVFPIYFKISSLNKEIKEKTSAIAKDLRVLALRETIEAETRKYETFLGGAKTDEEEVTILLKEIENIARKGALYIVEMKPAGIREDKNEVRRFIVNLTCEGQMEQVLGFMYSIESSSNLLSIEKYQISPKSKDSSIAQCSMTISKAVISD